MFCEGWSAEEFLGKDFFPLKKARLKKHGKGRPFSLWVVCPRVMPGTAAPTPVAVEGQLGARWGGGREQAGSWPY